MLGQAGQVKNHRYAISYPFVKNYNRHTCIWHHSQIIHNLDPISEYNRHHHVPLQVASHKSIHANITHESYIKMTKKHIFLNRLGVRYNSRIITCDLSSIITPNEFKGNMYMKKYSEFTMNLSSNSRTSSRQLTRSIINKSVP
jgi:hypothetical protein